MNTLQQASLSAKYMGRKPIRFGQENPAHYIVMSNLPSFPNCFIEVTPGKCRVFCRQSDGFSPRVFPPLTAFFRWLTQNYERIFPHFFLLFLSQKIPSVRSTSFNICSRRCQKCLIWRHFVCGKKCTFLKKAFFMITQTWDAVYLLPGIHRILKIPILLARFVIVYRD